MPTLKTPFWDASGKLYRPGSEIPASAFSAKQESEKAQTGASKEGTAYPHADVLSAGGFKTWDAVSGASNEDLLAVEGIGPARLAEIRAYKPE